MRGHWFESVQFGSGGQTAEQEVCAVTSSGRAEQILTCSWDGLLRLLQISCGCDKKQQTAATGGTLKPQLFRQRQRGDC
uniref:Uncharacterized protein n=1 Tax=Knipowitschia caucasica TaxID=637954 RepID=A0AAV2LPU5_KNICA